MSTRYKILNLETGEYLKSPVLNQSQQTNFSNYRPIHLYKNSTHKNSRKSEEDSIFSCEWAAEEYLESWRLNHVKVLVDDAGIIREKKPHRDIFEIVPVEI